MWPNDSILKLIICDNQAWDYPVSLVKYHMLDFIKPPFLYPIPSNATHLQVYKVIGIVCIL